jgi:hypothetical protein
MQPANIAAAANTNIRQEVMWGRGRGSALDARAVARTKTKTHI